MARVTHHWQPQGFQQILRSPSGGVVRDLTIRAVRVEAVAKRNLERHPRRVNTGLLRSSITHVIVFRGKPIARIGSNLHYARYVHDGTGIHGPRRRPIRPRTKKVLKFTPKGARKPVYARSVKGMVKNEYLKDALPAARR